MNKELHHATNETLMNSTYPGYPTRRLIGDDLKQPDNMTLPDGEWSTGVYVYPTTEQQDELRRQGYELDDFGRPLHPWLRDMLADPRVGVVTGLGEYWFWGPNKTADPIIITNEDVPRILLIQREDTRAWALPGGYVDPGETAERAAFRESAEEASVILSGSPLPIYDGVVADGRTTAHAWAETTALLWRVDQAATPHFNDGVVDASWFAIDELPPNLHGSHSVLIQQAIENLDAAPLSHITSFGERLNTIELASGGHMGYEHSIITTESGRNLFLKHHDDNVFTDSLKKSRSPLYLQKEAILYDHLANHAPDVIPTGVQMIGEHSLVMEGLTLDKGWRWRVNNESLGQYIDDTIERLLELESVPIVPEPFDYTIKPSHITHAEEGWKSIDKQTREEIASHLQTTQPHIRSLELRDATTGLIESLTALQMTAANLPEPDELFFAHHDLRQANIAWHPEHGTKIVDWSWAGPGRKHSDITTLLIDLYKYGHDVTDYMQYFNNDHALTLIGFWLAHSILPSANDNNGVRFQQVLSAASAYDLLAKNWER